jgi:hypothetical protein
MIFFEAHNARYRQVNDKRIQDIKQAMSLTEDPGVIEPNQLMVGCLVPQLKLLMAAIERLDRDIKQRYKKLDDRKLFDSLPGAGPVMAPRLLAAFGSNRDRYQTADEVQRYVGVAPVIEQSGQKSWAHWRYSCPTFLRQTFVEWVGNPYAIGSGRMPTTNNKKAKANRIKPLSARSHSSGYALSFVVGKPEPFTMNTNISRRLRNEIHRY